MKICKHCGHNNRDANKFCTQCGLRLDVANEFSTRLIMLTDNKNKAMFELFEGDNYIGREVENSIVIGDKQVSKRHALISYDGERYWITDLRSKNGVYVNGRKIKDKEALSDGCLIKIGSSIFKFQTTCGE